MLLFLVLALSSLVHSAPVVTSSLPLDCDNIYNLKISSKKNVSVPSGVYTIYPAGPHKPVKVYCDMGCEESDGHDNGRWTVIQRRIDGSVNFYRTWETYKNGFGNISGEYWLGLENIFMLTNSEKYLLRVDMEDFEKGSAYAQYTLFYINPESDNYKLNVGGYIDGGAGDALAYVNGMAFSTFDKDVAGSCAETNLGGFWFYRYWSCGLGLPNGLYRYGTVNTAYAGIMWQPWKGYYYSLKTITMKIRRMTLQDLQNL
ncbi:microfibril-associated glycoprotein 4-like [Clarias gariepinus]|uniref:microfibril-associated glycoprotein 4-like n=1 Tax=Clarias gariepinus TaxID=13013 RepID=UPI00234C1F1D|nr:microfibril-associated glycoprotein 4-like [Clarias gariepinus]